MLAVRGDRTVHGQLDVGPVEVADHHLGVAQPEPPHDLLPHRRRGRRGQRQPDRRADRLGRRAQPHVIRAEIAAPLADQVRLVHDEQPRPRALHRLPGPGRLMRVEHDRPQAGRPQVGQLIVLQRDQRRHDHHRPGPQQPGQLVDRRLARAGRQHGQHVPPGGQRADRAQLPGTELPEAQALARQLLDGGDREVVHVPPPSSEISAMPLSIARDAVLVKFSYLNNRNKLSRREIPRLACDRDPWPQLPPVIPARLPATTSMLRRCRPSSIDAPPSMPSLLGTLVAELAGAADGIRLAVTSITNSPGALG